MKKVVFVTRGLDVGGIEKYLLRFLSFSKDQLESIVICKGPEKDWTLESDVLATGANVIRLKVGYFNLIDLVKLYFLLRRVRPSAVCDFTGDFAGVTMLVARFANISIRVSFYRESEHQFKMSIFKNLYVQIMRYLVLVHSTSILSNSKAAFLNFYSGRKCIKFKLLNNGVSPFRKVSKREARRILNVPQSSIVVGHLGRFTTAKNHALIFEIAKKCSIEGRNLHFLFCGDGVDKNLLNFGLEQNTQALGVKKDVIPFFSAIDMFLFPSLNEGQPNALIEALVSNVPIIASDIPSIREVFPEKFHKRLINPYSIESFYDAVISNDVIHDQELTDWAIQEYNEQDRFNEFLRVLVADK